MRILKANKEYFDEWDKFLIESGQGHVLQSGIMAELWEYVSFKPLLIIVKEKGEIIGGVMSHIWFGNNQLLHPFRYFTLLRSQYGPIISNKHNKCLVLKEILKFMQKECNRINVMQHIISTPYAWGDDVFESFGYKPLPQGLRCTFLVGLCKSKENLFKSLHRDKRRGVKKAEMNNVKVIEGTRDETPKIFHRLHIYTSKRLGIFADPYSFIEGIWKILVPRGHAKFLFASYNGRIVAGWIFLLFNNGIYTYMSASLKEYHKLHVNTLLQWRILLYGLENGYEFCDLMGAPREEERNHPEYGLYRFKKGFGGEPVEIRFYSKVFSKKRLKIFNSLLIPTYRKFSFLSKFV
jgi:hypothetical protein